MRFSPIPIVPASIFLVRDSNRRQKIETSKFIRYADLTKQT